MKIGVVGLGYVGKSLADAAFEAGHSLVGVDVDSRKLKLDYGYPVSDDYSSLGAVEVLVIAVPTPLDENRQPDLSYLRDVVASLSGVLSSGTLVINESTSYPGTLRNEIAGKLGNGYSYAAAPERVDPGNAKWGIRNTPRVVAGLNEEATKKAVSFYQTICDEVVVVSSPEVAEAAKLFENTFRQVNIALVNEFAQIADSIGISTFEVLDAAASKPFGFMKFLPSVGVGGHCIPVDPSYLSYVAEKNGLEARFIDIANDVNMDMPLYVAKKIDEEVSGVKGKSVQIAGVAYKADVSDTRETPALRLISELRGLGADVSWHDPLVGEWNGERTSDLASVDIGVILAPHQVIDFEPWRRNGVRVFDVSTAMDLGWPKFL